MNAFRSTVMAAAACAAGLSLAACNAASSTAGPASPAGGLTSSSSASSSSPAAKAAAQTTPGCSDSGGMVTLSALVSSFPVPPGGQVVEDLNGSKFTGIVLSSVTPSAMEAFYTSTLPRDGYKITQNEEGLGFPELIFQGHGYTGVVAAAAGMGKVPKLPAGASARVCPGVSLSAVGKNIIWLSFAPGYVS